MLDDHAKILISSSGPCIEAEVGGKEIKGEN
jgi:hypothetical protein